MGTSNIARGDISRAGIIFLKDLQVRVLLECGYYSREGLIWGNTVPIIIESYLQPYNSTMERKATYLLLLKLSIDIPMTLPFNMY